MNMLLVLLLACGDDKTTSEETEETTATQSDSGDGTDTADQTEEITGTPVTFALSEAEGMKIGLLRVEFTDDGMGFTDNQIVSAELGTETSFTIGVETPDDEELSAFIPENDTLIGMWAPYLFQDSNGDNTHNEGETIGGIGKTWLVYAKADIPGYTITEGWSAIEMTFTEDPPIARDLENVQLDANLIPGPITIGGSYDTTLGDRRIAIVAATTFESGQLETMFDEVATDPWSLTLSGIPADNHFSQEDDFQGALGAAIVYEDRNNNGTFEGTDLQGQSTPITICFDGMGGMEPRTVTILYYPAVTNPIDALNASVYGMGTGWIIMANDDSQPYFPSPDEYNNLFIDANCVID